MNYFPDEPATGTGKKSSALPKAIEVSRMQFRLAAGWEKRLYFRRFINGLYKFQAIAKKYGHPEVALFHHKLQIGLS
jgi:hypothetical protein